MNDCEEYKDYPLDEERAVGQVVEILLTPEEIAEIEHDAHDICHRCEGEGRLWADGLAHYYDANRPTKACPECGGDGRVPSGNEGVDVARAQVRKVGDDMTKRGEAGLAALPIGEQGFWKGYWQALIDKGQALKAAGEAK